MAIVTPITRDPVERAAIERDLAGDPLGAIEIILADRACGDLRGNSANA